MRCSAIDMAGVVVGSFIVIRRAENSTSMARWICRCQSCGFEKRALGRSLRSASISHRCRCAYRPKTDASGRVTAEELRRLFNYEPATGVFTRISKSSQNARIGANPASGETSYQGINIGGQQYAAHHLAWLYMTGEWPIREIDHADTNAANNRWNNLRLASPSQNNANRKRSRANTSGFKGACWHKRKKKWQAGISVEGKNIFLGHFPTAEEAGAAYEAAAIKYFGEFARTA